MAQDWLGTLMSGVGGAFTGYGVARDRRMTEAERARLAQRQQQQDALGAFSTQLEQRAALDQLGYRPSGDMAVPRGTQGGMVPGSSVAAMVPTDAIVGAARRGPSLTTPQGESYTLDRLQTPDARRVRDTQMKQAEARAELDRRMQERDVDRAFEASENEKARAQQRAMDAARGQRGMSEAQSNTAANLLASRYDADPIVKNAKDVAQSYGRILATEDSAAGDLSLIFAYMKMLDPGSVVREGEFANAQNAAGVPDIIRNSYNRAATGERLNPNQRVQFRAQAKALADQQRRALQQTRQRYSQRAVPYGIDPDLLFSDPFELFDAVSGGAGGSAGPRPPNSPDDY